MKTANVKIANAQNVNVSAIMKKPTKTKNTFKPCAGCKTPAACRKANTCLLGKKGIKHKH